MNIGCWDIALVVAVTLQVAAVAYLYDPRWKAFAMTLPIPFTLGCLAVGKPVDATNAMSLIVLLIFVNGVRWLHYNAGMRIIPTILLCTVGCCLLAVGVAPHVPSDSMTFAITAAVVAVLAVIVMFNSPHVEERGYRTPLPVYFKLPGIAALVFALVLLKHQLGGFMTAFPMVTVFAAYESRHSLSTMCRQIPVILLTILPLMIVVRLTENALGLPLALMVGWVVFLIVLFPVNSLLRRKVPAAEPSSGGPIAQGVAT